MTRLTLILLMFSTYTFGQMSNLYRADGRLKADTTFQINGDSFKNIITLEKVLLPRMYNKIKYPEIARENGNEGMIIIQLYIDNKGFDYKIVKSNNDLLKETVVEYFDHIDKYIIDQIRPVVGSLNIYIPVIFEIQKNKFIENLKKNNSLTIETDDIAKQIIITK